MLGKWIIDLLYFTEASMTFNIYLRYYKIVKTEHHGSSRKSMSLYHILKERIKQNSISGLGAYFKTHYIEQCLFKFYFNGQMTQG